LSTTNRSPALAPFGVRSFRFQWPSGLAASWAFFGMETLIPGWRWCRHAWHGHAPSNRR
jgi:hypothetical protein